MSCAGLQFTRVAAQPNSVELPRVGEQTCVSVLRFQRLLEQILAECDAQGVDLPRGAVEDFLAGKIEDMARVLRIREDTLLRSYSSSINPAGIVAAVKAALDDGAREVADTTPTILDLATAGRLVASLGQAVRCVSLNHNVIADGDKTKWTAIGVLDNASSGVTLIGAALTNADITQGTNSILLGDEAVVLTRSSLTLRQTISPPGPGLSVTDQVWTRMLSNEWSTTSRCYRGHDHLRRIQ